MTGWGRNAAPPLGSEPRRGQLGVWSVACALLALVLVLATGIIFASLPAGASETASDIATTAVVASFLLVAPLLHVIGIVLGLVAVARGDDRRVPGVVGIALNLVLLAAGIGFVYAALQGMAAFT